MWTNELAQLRDLVLAPLNKIIHIEAASGTLLQALAEAQHARQASRNLLEPQLLLLRLQ